ncbi:MAG: hypothetical protein ACRED9_00005, partial [Caulobacteraceae bacterium]
TRCLTLKQKALADDLRARIASEHAHITTDAHNAYRPAVAEAFGADADYATLPKVYRTDPAAARSRTARRCDRNAHAHGNCPPSEARRRWITPFRNRLHL